MDTSGILVALVFLAAFNEFAIELVLGRFHNPTVNRFLPLASVVLGIGECLILNLNALPLAGIVGNALFGQVVTGVVLGAGSGGIHQFFGKRVRGNSNII